MKSTITFLTLALFSLSAFAQDEQPKNEMSQLISPWSFGVDLGFGSPIGDTEPGAGKFIGGIDVGYAFNRTLGVRLSTDFGQLNGIREQKDQYSFESNIIIADLQLFKKVPLSISETGESTGFEFSLGVGFLSHNTEGVFGNTEAAAAYLPRLQGETTMELNPNTNAFETTVSGGTINIPIGIAFYTEMMDGVDLRFGGYLRPTMSDDIDGFNFDTDINDSNDYLVTFQMGITYHLGRE
jgi:hypothetical protein